MPDRSESGGGQKGPRKGGTSQRKRKELFGVGSSCYNQWDFGGEFVGGCVLGGVILL